LSTPETAKQREERGTPHELFFDLVFVFAIAQVTSIQSEGV
jgi:low temperature requirement protein LtrA